MLYAILYLPYTHHVTTSTRLFNGDTLETSTSIPFPLHFPFHCHTHAHFYFNGQPHSKVDPGGSRPLIRNAPLGHGRSLPSAIVVISGNFRPLSPRLCGFLRGGVVTHASASMYSDYFLYYLYYKVERQKETHNDYGVRSTRIITLET